MIDHRGRIAYRLAEVAELFGIHERTIRRQAKAGELRTITVGRRVLIPATEVDRLAAGCSVSTTPAA